MFRLGAVLTALVIAMSALGDGNYEHAHLQVGMRVPEIVGVDQNGKAFRLSSYRGKVIVLDFFGFW